MVRIQFTHTYQDIISLKNLLSAWEEFLRGKKNKKDVQEFQSTLALNVFKLHQDLKNKTYVHGGYDAFNINDPKPRNIHKATVRDRLLHHAIYRMLYLLFDRTFISDSYSCRLGKGTHRAIKRFISFGNKVSKNNTKTCWVLKCDIRKFFASIDQTILLKILEEYIPDHNIVWLLHQVISSFDLGKKSIGLPLGNLTSQLLVNIYMNEFDQFMKHKMKTKYYIRYADDFVILSQDKVFLGSLIPHITIFLSERLKLSLHPDKVFIKTLSSGVDFLGWVHFPYHHVIRTASKRKMMRSIKEKEGVEGVVRSYIALLSHGNGYKLKEQIIKQNLSLYPHLR